MIKFAAICEFDFDLCSKIDMMNVFDR